VGEELAIKTLSLELDGPFEAQCEPVAKAFRDLADEAKQALSVVLGVDVEVTEPILGCASGEKLASAVDPSIVIVNTTFSKGIEGKAFFFSGKETVAALVGKVLDAPVEIGDEGLEGDALDAYLELVNQIWGKANLKFSDLAGSAVSTDSFAAYKAEEGGLEELLGNEPLCCAEYPIGIEGEIEGAIMFVLPQLTVEKLSEAGSGPSMDEIIAQATEEAEQDESVVTIEEPAARHDQPVTPERLNVLMDMDMPVYVRFGETQMLIKDVLQLGPGSIIELDKSIDSPVELVVNDKIVIAKGEVVVVDSNFAIRITEVKSRSDRIMGLG